MGRIKSKLVKRTSIALLKEENNFTHEFNDNKVLLNGITDSKKIRNQIAGYIARKKKSEHSSQKIKTE